MFFGFQEVLDRHGGSGRALAAHPGHHARRFSKFSTAATLMLLPYLIWVSFAGYLNGSILFLN